MKHEEPHGKNIKLAGFFFIVVLILILLSFLWRLAVLFANTRFDDKHQFILEIIGNASPRVVCFSPELHELSVMTVTGDFHEAELGKELELPIDAHISGPTNDSVAKTLWDSAFSFNTTGDINIVDKLRLWYFASTVHSDALSKISISVPVAEDTFTNVVQKAFLDKTLYQDTKTIEIINASSIPGFGGRLARLLTNIGGEVIMVNTSQSLADHSAVSYSGPYSYTTKRINQVLHIQETISSDKPALADIMITLGTDFASTSAF